MQVSLNATCTRDENGAILSYEGTVEDISDRKRTSEEAREARERYRQLVENANDIIYRTDAYGKFTYVNQQYLRMTGLTEEEALANAWRTVIHPDDFEQLERIRNESLLHRLDYAMNYRFTAR